MLPLLTSTWTLSATLAGNDVRHRRIDAIVSSVEQSSKIEIRSIAIVCVRMELSCSSTYGAPLRVQRTTSVAPYVVFKRVSAKSMAAMPLPPATSLRKQSGRCPHHHEPAARAGTLLEHHCLQHRQITEPRHRRIAHRSQCRRRAAGGKTTDHAGVGIDRIHRAVAAIRKDQIAVEIRLVHAAAVRARRNCNTAI